VWPNLLKGENLAQLASWKKKTLYDGETAKKKKKKGI